MIDPSSFLPDRELTDIASRNMAEMMAVELHAHGILALNEVTLAAFAHASFQGALALTAEHARLAAFAQEKGKKKKLD